MRLSQRKRRTVECSRKMPLARGDSSPSRSREVLAAFVRPGTGQIRSLKERVGKPGVKARPRPVEADAIQVASVVWHSA